jgi:hypothetical protein
MNAAVGRYAAGIAMLFGSSGGLQCAWRSRRTPFSQLVAGQRCRTPPLPLKGQHCSSGCNSSPASSSLTAPFGQALRPAVPGRESSSEAVASAPAAVFAGRDRLPQQLQRSLTSRCLAFAPRLDQLQLRCHCVLHRLPRINHCLLTAPSPRAPGRSGAILR